MIENIIFGKSGFNKIVFLKAFHLILMHFIHKILCFEEFLHKIALFFKKLCFLEFQSIESVSRPIENVIKILVWIYPFRSLLDWFWINRRHFQSIESNFRSIQNHIESFFKKLCFSRGQTLFQNFQKLFSLYSIGLRFKARFLSFSSKFLQGFLSSKAGKTFIPLLFHLFSCFHAFLPCIKGKLGFLLI